MWSTSKQAANILLIGQIFWDQTDMVDDAQLRKYFIAAVHIGYTNLTFLVHMHQLAAGIEGLKK